MIINTEWVRIRKEAVVYFTVLFKHSVVETGKNYENFLYWP